ncbi:MAG: TatD family hydrolase [Candidatus Binataceae bacterium]|nr:TatD family hydrolase [Candidatus Binataceae bacterium]
MPNLCDSHCHLADPRIHADLEGVLTRAAAADVGPIVAVGAIGAIETDRLTVELAEHCEGVYAAIGVHPHDADACGQARLDELRALARSPKVVAIGESGLDFHYLRSPAVAQEQALRRHLELAASADLPIVIHCRNAEQRLIEIVREAGMPSAGGVIHCFTGDATAAREFLALGFYLSFSGIVTFKNAQALRAVVPIVPDDRLMIETDAPYLAPEPYRGRSNEPAFLPRTLQTLAALRQTDSTSLSALVTANAKRLFKLG